LTNSSPTNNLGFTELAYSVVLRYDLLSTPGWESSWMIAQSEAYRRNSLDWQGDESGI
jgi:hypothetical protein